MFLCSLSLSLSLSKAVAGETSSQVLFLHAKRLRCPNRSLNDLPDEILLHILSFSPTLDAVTTSLVSRKWRLLWSLVPSLNFSYELFPLAAGSYSDTNQAQFFADFVDHTLILRPDSHIHTFRLSFIFEKGYGIKVHTWIRCAVTRLKARQLHIDLFINESYHGHRDSWYYEFDFSLLRSRRVEVLRLTNCFLLLKFNISTMNLCSMRSIYFERVDLTDQMVWDLILGCPNLEHLELRSCLRLKNLVIRSSRIKKLALGYDYDIALGYDYDSEAKKSIEIDCPNLCSLSFSDCNSAQFVLHEAPALVEFRVDFSCLTVKYFDLWSKIARLLEQAPHVEKLIVQNWWYKFLISKDPFPKDFELNNLNHLELRTGYTQYDLVGMAALLALCPNVQTMVLDYTDKIKEDENLPEELLNEVAFNIPKLKKVTMVAYTGTQVQVDLVTILNRQGTLASKDPFLKSFMLHNLNHLELYTDYTQTFLVGMAALLELCPNLETMVLNDLEIKDLPEEFPNESIQFKIPRLKQVTMKLYDGSKNQRNLLTILKMQGVVLEKIVLVSSRPAW